MNVFPFSFLFSIEKSPLSHALSTRRFSCYLLALIPVPPLPPTLILLNSIFKKLPCERGYWCSQGIKHPCRAGLFGWTFGASSAECGGKCDAGYRCPMASIHSKPIECAEGFSESVSERE
jgi:hypothetical protein